MSLRRRPRERRPRALVPVLALALFATEPPPAIAGGSRQSAMTFAADMAKRGNWREAQFRWESLISKQPDDPWVLNNLGVAAEALGNPERARELYGAARTLAPREEHIEDNLQRFEHFWSQRLEGDEKHDDVPAGPPTSASSPAGESAGKGKPARVTLELPVPPRLDTTGYDTLLVASFLTDDNSMIDVNRELVRFLRGKLSRDPDFEVLDVTPAPAIPEQRLEDLIANSGFWKYLGREYGADLVVSGVVDYGREDHSGFEEVDRIDPRTGQKVRTSEFVERERFTWAFEILFMSGASGELVYRDRIERSAIYRGSNNDPITAFHDLTDALTPDLMAIVEPRTRQDARVIFKK